jgi:hypothetical protein
VARKSKASASVRNERSIARPSGWTEDSDQNEAVYLLYDDLIRSRDRLAGLGPATPQDMERVDIARHEVMFHLLTPPLHMASDLPVSRDARIALVGAARDRAIDLFVGLIALVAQKVAASQRTRASRTGTLSVLGDALDALTFDYRAPKKETLGLLRQLREDSGRIAYVKGVRPAAYRFSERPELYRDRADKRETPDRFFERVYRAHARRGLTQVDIRLVDPAYYNVLHVWCNRHERSLASLVPPSRSPR